MCILTRLLEIMAGGNDQLVERLGMRAVCRFDHKPGAVHPDIDDFDAFQQPDCVASLLAYADQLQ